MVVVISYAIQSNYCCLFCDHSAFMQSTETADFIRVNCDEKIRERGGDYA